MPKTTTQVEKLSTLSVESNHCYHGNDILWRDLFGFEKFKVLGTQQNSFLRWKCLDLPIRASPIDQNTFTRIFAFFSRCHHFPKVTTHAYDVVSLF